jgi:hypothetical protein
MDLKDWNSGTPATKPWLKPKCFSLECQELSTTRLIQANGHLTPYSLWTCLNNLNVSGTSDTFAMGIFVGPVAIPSASCYNGLSVRIVLSGLLTTTIATTTTFSIKNLAGTYTHASTTVVTAGAFGPSSVRVEFDIQIAAVGGPGVGLQRSVGASTVLNLPGVTNTISDGTTFSSTGGVEYYLYAQHSAAGASFLRQLAYATVLI